MPFPFTDQSTAKQRPGVIVSSADYHDARHDLILMAVTSQLRGISAFGELIVEDWQAAKLLKPSAIKPVLATLEQSLVLKTLGRLSARNSSVYANRSARSSGNDPRKSTRTGARGRGVHVSLSRDRHLTGWFELTGLRATSSVCRYTSARTRMFAACAPRGVDVSAGFLLREASRVARVSLCSAASATRVSGTYSILALSGNFRVC
ncbi:MAG TPA: type II toxin-antitoxin system PemK/MazF family toxin [Gammaproteobacteria bacterium]|nr:type II toxin-antitoxin system PemK/MazF family toxin [Gammaproteobacteria bacterium]